MFLSLLLPRTTPRWVTSEFSQLPVFDHGEPPHLRDWRLLAGGLALLLSRCSERGARRDFPASLETWRILKRQSNDPSEPFRVSSRLLNELRHEISGVADAATCEAARRCMERQLPQRTRH